MGRRFLLTLMAISLVVSISPMSMVLAINNNALEIHFNSITVDSHNDTMMKVIDDTTWLPEIDINGNTNNHIDIPKLKAGGLKVPFFAAFTSGFYGNTPRSISRTLALINALYWTERNNIDNFKISTSVDQIEKAVGENKIAAVPTIEGAYSLDSENAIELIRQYYDLGIRVVGFTWNFSNDLGEGAKKIFGDIDETPSSGGLTTLGEKVIKEMNRLGMIVDVSHMSENTFWGVIKTSKAPIIASHSGAYTLKNHVRNLNDDQLKALAENRGVIGIVLYPEFLTSSPSTYISDYVDHIDYVVKLIGIDHVGIGSDFDGAKLPEDLKDSSQFYKITEELVRRNYSREDIEKLLGKNTLRVLKEVEEVAQYNKDTRNNIYIIPEYEMGEKITDTAPLVKARVESDMGLNFSELDFRAIVDGVPFTPKFDDATSTLYYKLQNPLEEKFHVVTFEAINKDGHIARQSRIFYIN